MMARAKEPAPWWLFAVLLGAIVATSVAAIVEARRRERVSCARCEEMGAAPDAKLAALCLEVCGR